MTFEQFIAKLSSDSELAERMSKAANPEEAYDFAKDVGLTISFDEFLASAKKLTEAAGDMSTDDVDAIVGGANATEIIFPATTLSNDPFVTGVATSGAPNIATVMSV